MPKENEGVEKEGTAIDELEVFDNLEKEINAEEDDKKADKTATDSSTEIKDEDGDASSSDADKKDAKKDDDEPFHKHPRFKELVDEKNRVAEERDSFKSMADELTLKVSELEDIVDKINKPQTPQINEELLDKFEELYGTRDVKAFEKWKSLTSTVIGYDREALINEAKKQIYADQEKTKTEAKYWQDWVNKQVGSVIDNKLIEPAQRNELLKIMEEYAPTDKQGNLDFAKGAELLKLKTEKGGAKSDERKKIASKTIDSDTGDIVEEKAQSNITLRHKSMRDLIE